jgi:TolB-like protein
VKRSALYRLSLVLILLSPAYGAFAQADSARVAMSHKVAVLPFANLAEAADIAPQIAGDIRLELKRKLVEVADSAVVAEVLRQHRIRNTFELDLGEVEAVAQACSARYLLFGSIDHYEQADSSAEVAFSARLLDVSTESIVWANSAALQLDPRSNLLGIGSHRADRLAQRVLRKLFSSFRYSPLPKMKVVQAVRMAGKTPPEKPCRKIMLVTFGNETETHFAGNVLANQLLTSLSKRGFALVDPGRVRETMLSAKDLMQGEISRDLLKKCCEELGADFVLTGTVSRFETVRMQSTEAPAVAFETRLIDAQKGEIVWAKAYTREGKDSAWIFNLGCVHGLTVLSEKMSQRVAKDIPVRRARVASVSSPVEKNNP